MAIDKPKVAKNLGHSLLRKTRALAMVANEVLMPRQRLTSGFRRHNVWMMRRRWPSDNNTGRTRRLTRNVRPVYMTHMHLSDYMAQRGLKDQDVAPIVGVNRVSISRYRRRLVVPSWPTIERIRKFTGSAVTERDWAELANKRGV